MKLCAAAGVAVAIPIAPATQSDKHGENGSDEAAAHRGSGAPEVRRPTQASLQEGGESCHYPSSWYSKAKKPARPPTHTGSHAAAIGCINSALLKSSVTFDRI